MKKFLLLLNTIDDKSGGSFFAFIVIIGFLFINTLSTIYDWHGVPVIEGRIGTLIFAFFINGFFNVLHVIVGGIAVAIVGVIGFKAVDIYKIVKNSVEEVYNVELEDDKSKSKVKFQ